jgi:outer membrane translocation and assembly module TamA
VRPTHGWRVILKLIHTNKALFSDFEYTRYLFDAGYLRAFNTGHQIAGLRINGEWIEAPFHRVPFWELSELGGQDTLRGFFPHRFVGKARALFNLECRSRLTEFDFYRLWHGRLDGVVFGDGGRVFLDNNDLRNEFRLNGPVVDRLLNDFQYSYGAGLRLALSEAIVARLDAGFSNEETGLLYLSFGHTF